MIHFDSTRESAAVAAHISDITKTLAGCASGARSATGSAVPQSGSPPPPRAPLAAPASPPTPHQVACALDAARMLDLHLLRHEERTNLHVRRRLRFPHLQWLDVHISGSHRLRADEVGAERSTRPFPRSREQQCNDLPAASLCYVLAGNTGRGSAAPRPLVDIMTPEQVDLIRHSFDAIWPIRRKLAGRFYSRFFELAPDARRLFPSDMERQHLKLTDMIAAIWRARQTRNIPVHHSSYGSSARTIRGEAIPFCWVW